MTGHEQNSAPAPKKTALAKSILLAVAKNLPYFLAIAATVYKCIEHLPIRGLQPHEYAYKLTLAALGIAVAFFILRYWNPALAFPWRFKKKLPANVPTKILYTLLICSCIFGVFNYYKFDKGHLYDPKRPTAGLEHMDLTYYYVNSKYFDELGHFYLYPAILTADEEGPNRLRGIVKYRDLRTYDSVRRAAALTPELRAEIKGRFTPERWENFKNDVNYFTSHYGRWDYLMADRGYNPPATWTLVGGALSNAAPVEKLKLIAMIDFALITLMFVLIARAFGPAPMLFALLWFATTYSGKWPMVGQALLRFDWVAALIMAVCMLKLNRHGWAGGLLAYAALSRVFPILFIFPYGLLALYHLIQKRRFAPEHLRFIYGACAVLFVMVNGALLRLGPQSFVETAKNLSIHASSYSSHRIGLGDALVYRGETNWSEYMKNGGPERKKQEIIDMKPWLNGIGLAALAIIAVYVWKRRLEAHRLIYLAAIPLYCVTNAQSNYYNFRLILMLEHASNLSLHRNKIGLLLLFLVETATQLMMIQGASTRYPVTSTASIGMLIYFIVMLAFMEYDILEPSKKSSEDHEQENKATPAGAKPS